MPTPMITGLEAVKTDAIAAIGDVALIALPVFGLILVIRLALKIFKMVKGG